MSSSRPFLLSRALGHALARLDNEPKSETSNDATRDATRDAIWSEARAAFAESGEDAPDVRGAIESRDAAALRALVEGWSSGKRLLPAHDRALLQHAMKAFRKSLKLTRLDAESSIAGGPMSRGRESGIVGITPPPHYPREVWDELVKQGRLLRDRHGMVELPPE